MALTACDLNEANSCGGDLRQDVFFHCHSSAVPLRAGHGHYNRQILKVEVSTGGVCNPAEQDRRGVFTEAVGKHDLGDGFGVIEGHGETRSVQGRSFR